MGYSIDFVYLHLHRTHVVHFLPFLLNGTLYIVVCACMSSDAVLNYAVPESKIVLCLSTVGSMCNIFLADNCFLDFLMEVQQKPSPTIKLYLETKLAYSLEGVS